MTTTGLLHIRKWSGKKRFLKVREKSGNVNFLYQKFAFEEMSGKIEIISHSEFNDIKSWNS